jgi:hypothetical protein
MLGWAAALWSGRMLGATWSMTLGVTLGIVAGGYAAWLLSPNATGPRQTVSGARRTLRFALLVAVNLGVAGTAYILTSGDTHWGTLVMDTIVAFVPAGFGACASGVLLLEGCRTGLAETK